MNDLKICVNTQTPLVMFSGSQEELARKYGWSENPMQLANLIEWEDYQFTSGGVTRMVLPLVRGLIQSELAGDVHWVSLNPRGPANVQVDDKITLHRVGMERENMEGYGRAKEAMWNVLHGTDQDRGRAKQVLWEDEFSDYTYYNRRSAELITRLDEQYDFDLFYIHDFQQLPVGSMLNTLKPKVFRWHIPFNQSNIPPNWTEFLTTFLNGYDSIIVSNRQYLTTLKQFGYKGQADYVYPYIDPTPYQKPSREQSRDFNRRFGIRPRDKVLLMVARLDPVKGHNIAIQATATALREDPNLKLVLVGNGSFSSSGAGVGLSKAQRWKTRLLDLAGQLGISDRVVFTGHLSQTDLNAAYDRCQLTVLPSVAEGFGLVVIESWLFHKPAIVTKRSGIIELIHDRKNGLVCDPEDPAGLADMFLELVDDRGWAEKLGENGYATSKKCMIGRGVRAESRVLSRLS